MLSALHLENFKSFREPTEVPLAPLTLIFGANSSGKSTLIHALAFYGQSLSKDGWRSVEKPRRTGGTYWTWSGTHVDLGGFKNVIFGHDSSAPMAIGVDMREGIGVTRLVCRLAAHEDGVAQTVETVISLNDTIAMKLTAGGSNPRRSALQMDFAHFWELYRMHVEGHAASVGLDLDNFDLDKGLPLDELEKASKNLYDEYQKEDFNEATHHLTGDSKETLAEFFPQIALAGDVLQINTTGPLPRHAFIDYLDSEWPDGAPADVLNAMCGVIQDGTRDLVRPFERAFRHMAYLGPVRAEPQRIEELHNLGDGGRPSDGHGTTGLLYREPRIKRRVNEAFQLLEIPYKIDAVKISNADYPTVGEFLALQLVDLRTNVPVSPADVGYGISQLLPILTEAASERSGPLLIEQPELHLHPRLQGKLAELLAQASQHRQIIAETHSESIVLRLQTLIRRGDLDPSDVAVIYVGSDDGDGSGAWIQPIEFGSTGEMLQEWPGGFFEDRLEDY